MKCPKCGSEIPEGKMYCEKCGTEIHIVKEYDAGLEQQISDNMSSIREEVRRQIEEEEKLKRTAERKKHLRLMAAAAAAAAAGVCILVFFLYYNFLRPTQARYVGRAYEAEQNGDYKKAAEFIDRALNLDEDGDVNQLLLKKAAYLEEAGEYEDAEVTVREVIADKNLTGDELIDAYGSLIQIYADQKRFDEIAQFLSESPKEVQSKYSGYLCAEPTFSEKDGSYQKSFHLILGDDSGGTIFYTLDGTDPTIDSSVYSEPILLSSGEYTVCAVVVNKYGVRSKTARHTYKIGNGRLATPIVDTDSGTYSGVAMIKVEDPSSGKVYYTTDGSEPTEESNVYTGPIEMPSGNSTYIFITIDEFGNKSDTVERNYTLTPSAQVSKEDGPSYIITALMNLGQVIDANGTVTGGNACYSYEYEETQTVSGYGSFYIYNEVLIDSAGNSAVTGRRFAVNVSNAIVNLYTTGGELVPIS